MSTVIIFVSQTGREFERFRKHNNATRPYNGFTYTTSIAHYCPQHPPIIIVVLCSTNHSLNTKQSTKYLLVQTLFTQTHSDTQIRMKCKKQRKLVQYLKKKKLHFCRSQLHWNESKKSFIFCSGNPGKCWLPGSEVLPPSSIVNQFHF